LDEHLFSEVSASLYSWKVLLSSSIFDLFVDCFTYELCKVIRKELPKIEFTAIGALYLELVVSKLKKNLQVLTEKPMSPTFYELEELVQILCSQNIEEAESLFEEKEELGSVFKRSEIVRLMGQRVDVQKAQLKNAFQML
jgi:hypothetical protein